MGFHFFNRRLVDQRPLRSVRLESWRGLQGLHGGHQLCSKRIVHRVLHQKSIAADAGLPGVAIFGSYGALDRGVQVRIVEYQERSISPQLQREFFDGAGALSHQNFPNFGGASKRKLAHGGVRSELRANFHGIAGNYVEDTLGYSSAFGKFRKSQRRKRSLLGRLDDHSASGGKGRRG